MIPYQGQWVFLQGLDAELPNKLMLQVCQIIDASNAQSSSSNLYPAVLSILDQFPLVLALLTDLPPSRSCNHSIPLIPGAQPVFIRPYRYPLRIKDEIEARVKETLEQGLIQPSTTPFSSPMLLVKKKDDSYYFCVDFR
jgi:hypothetical protein